MLLLLVITLFGQRQNEMFVFFFVDTSAGPIVIQVRTDASVTGRGFKLFYMQNPCPRMLRQ